MTHPIPMQSRTTSPSSRTLLAGTLFLAVGFLAGCNGEEADAQDQAGGYERVINVEVLPVHPERFTELVRVTGTVHADQDVTVSSEEVGVVRELMVERGQRVQEGAPLLRIDDRLVRAQLAEAEARESLASESWERRRRLFEEDGIGSELAYLEARYQYEQARAQREQLQERIDRTVVRAPLSGTLEERMVEVGTMVGAGTALFRIVNVNPVKVRGGVPERFAGDVRVGASARVTLDVLRGEAFQGTIRYVGATVNPRNRTFEVEVLVPNPERLIKPEMVASLEITRGERESVLVIPQEAVVRTEEGFVAFVAERDGDGERGVARVRPLVLGPAQRNVVVVEEGLAAGDLLIVVGHQQVAEGDRIQIVRTRPARAAAAPSDVAAPQPGARAVPVASTLIAEGDS